MCKGSVLAFPLEFCRLSHDEMTKKPLDRFPSSLINSIALINFYAAKKKPGRQVDSQSVLWNLKSIYTKKD